MTRPSRIEYPGAIDQGMPRGSLTRSVFEDDCDWRRLLEGLEQTVGRLGGDLLSFVLLPNNFHLSLRALQPDQGMGHPQTVRLPGKAGGDWKRGR